MINVNQITSQLARMPDQALQQYAMMHKNDPYTVSLALSESNRRKQMRDAAQGQQGMAPQPKVVDQGIAGMMAPSEMNPAQMEALIQQLDRKKEQEYREFTRGAAPTPQPMPEDVGIGALPAPNMQRMAEGGIVAFGGGGDVPGYAGGTLVDQIEAANQMSLRTTGFPLNAAQRARLEQTITSNIAEETAGRAAGAAGLPFNPISYIPQAAPTPAPAAVVIPPVVAAPGAPTVAPPSQQPPAPTKKVPPAAGPRPAPAPVAPVAPVVPEQDYLTQLDEMRRKAGDVVDPLAKRRTALTDKQVKSEIAALSERNL